MVPHQDEDAAELEHAEEVGLVILPADHQSAEVMQPGEQTLDLPAAAVAAQFATVLRLSLAPVRLVRRDQTHALLSESLIQRVAIIGAVAWRSACNPHGDRKTM